MSRTHRVRSIALVLIGMMLGAVMVAPAFAYHTPRHTKKQVAKVRKALVEKIDAAAAIADAKFEPTGTITTFGQVKMNVGDPDKLLATVGPFSWVAQCQFSGGNDLIAQILITTSEPNRSTRRDTRAVPSRAGRSRWGSTTTSTRATWIRSGREET